MEYCTGFCQSFMFWLKSCEIFWLQNTKEKTVQTIHFITKIRCLFLAKAQQDIYKCHLPFSRLIHSYSLTQKTQMMIRAQQCGAVCHPELCKLRSSGLSKPQSGEMPTPWFVQLVLCQRGISWDRGGLKFLWILFNLCWEMINGSKPSNSIGTRFFQLGVGSVVFAQDAFLSE